MHIGIDVRVLSTGRVSGVEEYTRNLLSHLLRLDPAVTFTLTSLGRTRPETENWSALPNVRLRHVRIPGRVAMGSMRAFGVPRLDRIAGNPDVFFFPHFIFGAVSGRCRRVMTFHDLSFEHFPEFFSLRRRLWHRVHMRPQAQARRTDRIIAVSDSTARDLRACYGIEPSRIRVIHSGVEERFVPLPEHEVRAFRRYNGLDGPFILALCTREPRKNLVGLVKAFERLAQMPRHKEISLVLAGPDGWLQRELSVIIRRSPVRDRIQTRGLVGRAERVLWYNAATLFAYPSYFEGFGFPPLEAMACGTPVMAAHASSLPEVVGDAGLLVDPYDLDEMAYAMDRLLTERDLVERLTAKGIERSARFSWQRAAQETLDTLVHTH